MKKTCVLMLLLLAGYVHAQQQVSLNDLSAFKNPGKNWQICGNVFADLQQNNSLRVEKGNGILVNLPDSKDHGTDLYTNAEFADLDLELDYMMAKGSNSGVYLQGRYELQLLDSWAGIRASSGDNGGIYERWDENRGKGNEGFDGHAARQNVSRAPGLWQTLRVVYQAPRFDAAGKKIENARMIRVELNGVLIHENVELAGPTRGAVSQTESATGPLRFQGDHGAVAFRNIRVKNYTQPRPEISELQYKIFDGQFRKMPSLDTMKAQSSGSTPIISSAVVKKDNDFLLHYTGKVNIKSAGNYLFKLHTTGGVGALKVNNQLLRDFNGGEPKPIALQPGTYPIEIQYAKWVNWERNSLGLSISSDEVREFLVSDPGSLIEEAVDPILVDASGNTLLRSFMDVPNGKRVVHAVNVGSSKQLHFTYDLDNGSLFQAWRGNFLDATPMWHDRGDGSSRPMGSIVRFGQPSFAVRRLGNEQEAWSNDTTNVGFVTKGYEVDALNNPTFLYSIYGAQVRDEIKVSDNGQSLDRKISLDNAPAGAYLKIAEGKTIENVAPGLYAVDDKSYYVRFENNNLKPTIRTQNGKAEMIVAATSPISYSIVF